MTDVATIVRNTLVNTRAILPEITDETSFAGDLRCDSIDMVCIEIEVGDAFGVELPACEFENCETIADLAALVQRQRTRARHHTS